MAQYKTDFQDIFFNLFKVLKVQERDHGLSEDDLKDVIRQLDNFVEKEIFPTRQVSDKEGAHLVNGQVKVPTCLHSANQKFYENGWQVLGLSEEEGGMPVPEAVYIACHSLWVGANVAWSMYPGLSRAAMNVIAKIGSSEQKDLYLPPMREGRWGGTMCLTEAGAGSDVGALRTTAVPTDKGTYKIKGVKIFISSGESDLYENNIHLVLARTPGGAPGTKGISLFVVPRFKINPDGSKGAPNDVVCTKIEEKMGLHAQGTCELTFGANDSCEGYLIGKEFEGMKNMFIMMNEARLSCGVQGEGQANLAYQLTLQYVKERAQFGTEIVNHPDVKRSILRMRALSRGMRALCYYAADLFDEAHGQENTPAALEVGLLTPIVKSYCSAQGFNLAVEAIQLHGGYGYCTEYGIEQFARDIKIATIYEGTNAIQAIDLVTRKILKDGAKTFKAVGEKIVRTLSSSEVKAWEKESNLMQTSLGKAQAIVETMGKWAMSGDHERMLQHCSDFQDFCGHLLVGWRLMENARVAQQHLKNSSANPDETKHYQTVVDDMKIFFQNYLVENVTLAKRILDFDHQLKHFSL